MAQYEEGPGSVLLNMDLIQTSPQANKPFLVITGVSFRNCREDGLPTSDEFDRLYAISDATEAAVAKKTTYTLAGAFTHQCQRLDYIYVADTTGLRKALTALHKANYSGYEYYLNIKMDREWGVYREFLYPNEEILEDIRNRDVLIKLMDAGDDLSQARQVDHWLYFPTEKTRKAFTAYARKQGYTIEETGKDQGKNPFKIRISRTDKVDPASINAQTLALKREARKHKGNYDGWETFVIKQ